MTPNSTQSGDIHALSAADLIGLLQEANQDRDFVLLPRRLLKAGEELGEANQAYLRSTGTGLRRKTTADLREEIIDLNVVALDLLLHRLPGEEELSEEAFAEMLLAIFKTKLAKWRHNQTVTQFAA